MQGTRLSLCAAAGALVLAGCGGSGDTPGDRSTPADATRLVGLGHAAVEVPDSWGTNESTCGTPAVDTVVVDIVAPPSCTFERPRKVESVDVLPGRAKGFTADEDVSLDGTAAQRQATACAGDVEVDGVCTAMVFVPSEKVTFRIQSSTSAAAVDRILQGVQIVPDRTGVPGYATFNIANRSGAGTKYAAALRVAGLRPSLVEQEPDEVLPPGYVLGADPAPGAMLEKGAAVEVQVAAPPK